MDKDTDSFNLKTSIDLQRLVLNSFYTREKPDHLSYEQKLKTDAPGQKAFNEKKHMNVKYRKILKGDDKPKRKLY